MTKSTKSVPSGADLETWDEEPYFNPRSYMNGRPRANIETWSGPRLPCLDEGGWLGFDFEDGVTDQEAVELVRLMNLRIKRITYTGPAKPGWRPGRKASRAIAAKADAELDRIVKSSRR